MVYSLTAGTLLAYVYIKTEPIIQANRSAVDPKVLSAVLPGMDGGYELKGSTEFPYYIGYKDPGKTVVGGYIFTASGKGYSSTVKTLVGVDTTFTIVGARVTSQQETPGLGDKLIEIKPGATSPWFTDQFKGLSIKDKIAVKKDAGTIDALTGATISSRGVANSIQTGLKNMQAALTGGTIMVADTTSVPEEPEVAPAEQPTRLAEISPDDTTSAGLENLLWVAMPGMWGGYEEKKAATGFTYWVGYRDSGKKEIGGYAFVAKGKGYSSIIQTLVLTDAKGTITNTRILFQQEVPGTGDKILEIRGGEDSPWFTKQFVGKTANVISLKADGGSIDAITGATESSKGVTESVAAGLKTLMQSIN